MDRLYKILIIGDSGVGKTSILNRFSTDTFNESFISTIGVDFKIKKINVNGTDVKLQVWDTAGQERFRTITSSYYRGAHGIIIVFDVSDRESFLNVDHWIKEIDSFCVNRNIQKILIGNKIDLERKVTHEEANYMALKYGITYLEVSSKFPNTSLDSNTSSSIDLDYSPIDNIFKILVDDIINNRVSAHTFRDDGPDPNKFIFQEKKDRGCCS